MRSIQEMAIDARLVINKAKVRKPLFRRLTNEEKVSIYIRVFKCAAKAKEQAITRAVRVAREAERRLSEDTRYQHY